jgi:F-type H+-transporting ATPase subunit alpha
VGGKAQRAAYRAVAGDLKLAYAQFEELETFARFGARLDDDTRQAIAHGQRIRACLGQAEFSPVSVPAQIAILLALNAALFDAVPLERMAAAQRALEAAVNDLPDELTQRLVDGDALSDADREQVTEAAREALESFLAQDAEAPP